MSKPHDRPRGAAAMIVLALWAPYALLNTIFPGPALTYALGLALALAAQATLGLAGAGRDARFLRLGPLSWQGALILALLALFIPAALLAGRAQPFSPLDDLVYAPASALAQELYFRSALLVALDWLLDGRARSALTIQAALFSVWHVRAFAVVGPVPALGVLALTFIAGLLWAAQARHDRTIVYAALQHTLFLIVQ